MQEVISMSAKELSRLKILDQLDQNLIKQRQDADILGVIVKQVKRLLKAYKTQGPIGIISQKIGKAINRRLSNSIKELALALIEHNHVNFGPTLARENLIKLHGLEMSVSSIRNLMISKGLWVEKRRKSNTFTN